jgi:pyridoxine 4-dehydrogenase
VWLRRHATPRAGCFQTPRGRDQALTGLRRALKLGVNHIDTTQYYGPNIASELVHEALYPYPENPALVSKVSGRPDEAGGWLPAQEPDELRARIEDNLRSLEKDQLATAILRVRPENFDPQTSPPGEP